MTPEEIKASEEKLKTLENELQQTATDLDKKTSEIKVWEDDLGKRETQIAQKLKLGTSAEAFEKLTKLITELYTTYVGIRGNDEGLDETIKSILDARKKLQA